MSLEPDVCWARARRGSTRSIGTDSRSSWDLSALTRGSGNKLPAPLRSTIVTVIPRQTVRLQDNAILICRIEGINPSRLRRKTNALIYLLPNRC
jgi:hypothetical protein